MRKKGFGWLIGIACLAAVVALIVLLGGGAQDFHEKYEGVDLTADVSGLGREDTYTNYLMAHADAPSGSTEAVIDITAFEGDAEIREENGVVKLSVVMKPDKPKS